MTGNNCGFLGTGDSSPLFYRKDVEHGTIHNPRCNHHSDPGDVAV